MEKMNSLICLKKTLLGEKTLKKQKYCMYISIFVNPIFCVIQISDNLR